MQVVAFSSSSGKGNGPSLTTHAFAGGFGLSGGTPLLLMNRCAARSSMLILGPLPKGFDFPFQPSHLSLEADDLI